jgi:co-chaperonin GroES (HSP10)
MNGNILATKILCKEPLKVEKKTNSGLILPSIIKTDQICADVVITGDGTPTVDIPVKIGQRVIFNPHAPQRVTIESEEYLLIDIRDVLFFYTPSQE